MTPFGFQSGERARPHPLYSNAFRPTDQESTRQSTRKLKAFRQIRLWRERMRLLRQNVRHIPIFHASFQPNSEKIPAQIPNVVGCRTNRLCPGAGLCPPQKLSAEHLSRPRDRPRSSQTGHLRPFGRAVAQPLKQLLRIQSRRRGNTGSDGNNESSPAARGPNSSKFACVNKQTVLVGKCEAALQSPSIHPQESREGCRTALEMQPHHCEKSQASL